MDIDFAKGNGLVPVIVQDDSTMQVIMLGYMNQEAYDKTVLEKKVCFYSRSKQRLWTKGEESGNHLLVKDIKLDCDRDTLLVLAKPIGPICHLGFDTCFGPSTEKGFIYQLEKIIDSRISSQDDTSYTYQLFQKGINKIAQKVGEEAVELIIESKDEDQDLFVNEAADLMFHLMILLRAKGVDYQEIEETLYARRKRKMKVKSENYN